MHKQLTTILISRLSLITITISLLILSAVKRPEWLTMLNLAILLIIQFWLLIRKMNQINRDLSNFFNSITNNDSSLRLPDMPENSKLARLYNEMQKVNKHIQQIKIEHYNQNLYYRKILDHIGTGVIVYEHEGDLILVNAAAKKLLKAEIHSFGQLKRIVPELHSAILELKTNQERLIKWFDGSNPMSFLVKATQINLNGNIKKIITLQNIKNELDNKELESYQKLIRVLTHEIMNSTAPITSSIKVLTALYRDEESGKLLDIDQLNENIVKHTVHGLEIIDERSTGLSEFVSKYRSLTRIPELKLESINLNGLVNAVAFLFDSDMREKRIEFKINSEGNITIQADKELLSQVLINLFRNAIEALTHTDNPKIEATLSVAENSTSVKFCDNGPGMDDEVLRQIFIPFYTTKPDGSGIGLSLARQIMRKHNGDIFADTKKGKGTCFTLQF